MKPNSPPSPNPLLSPRSTINCDPRPGVWRGARLRDLQPHVDYLYVLSRKPNIPPRTCRHVSCAYHAAVWLCNDVRLSFFSYPISNVSLVAERCVVQTRQSAIGIRAIGNDAR